MFLFFKLKEITIDSFIFGIFSLLFLKGKKDLQKTNSPKKGKYKSN